ncbi:ribonuclease R [Gemella cuniculi]|uniref:ribonuclease R n=1 Tax=Gemella cuniculi TaxID=150240 RepID=UPI00040CF18E|nr:ribonuclease R [Gemella cuniculi]
MVENILRLFRENKILSVEELKEKLNIESAKEFVALIKKIGRLEERMIITQLPNEKFLYTKEKIQAEGIIKVHAKGFAFVYSDILGIEIYIPKGYTQNAMTGDKVLVTIDNVNKNEKNISGIVQKIVERNTKYTVGTLTNAKFFSFVKSDDKNISKYIKIENSKNFNLDDGYKVLVEITYYSKTSFEDHQGIIIKTLGHKDDPGMDILSTIHKHAIPNEFPVEVEEEIKTISEDIKFDDRYIDCTQEMVVTIDGDDAKDLDDAISVVKTKKGYKLKVFIADVSHYVEENSFLDQEAARRGCSVYLVDRVVPMLPRKLSNNICSLNPHVLRYTICCDMEFNERGYIDSYDIYPALIKSKGRLSYKKVNEVYENSKETIKEYKPYISMLKSALELSKKIRENRQRRGAIDFDKDESKVLVDESGNVLDIVLRERGTAEKLIEDFMLSANEVIGEHFYWMQVPFIYRIHEEPKVQKLKQFFDIAANFGYRTKGNIEKVEPYMLSNMLQKFKGEVIESMLSTILLRTMNQARYSTSNIGHFALATKYYTHFTSPIRRYPDLLVHRMIRKYLFVGDVKENTLEHYSEILPKLAESSSEYEKRAVDCEREVDRIKKCEYMCKYQEKRFKGVVSGITSFGIFITLENTIEGLAHIKTMKDDYYVYDEKNMLLIGTHNKKVYRLGDEVIVKVDNVDIDNQEIDFKILKHKSLVNKK